MEQIQRMNVARDSCLATKDAEAVDFIAASADSASASLLTIRQFSSRKNGRLPLDKHAYELTSGQAIDQLTNRRATSQWAETV